MPAQGGRGRGRGRGGKARGRGRGGATAAPAPASNPDTTNKESMEIDSSNNNDNSNNNKTENNKNNVVNEEKNNETKTAPAAAAAATTANGKRKNKKNKKANNAGANNNTTTTTTTNTVANNDNNKTANTGANDNNKTTNTGANKKNQPKKRSLNEMKSDDIPMEDKEEIKFQAKRKKNFAPFARFRGKTNRMVVHGLPFDITEEEVTNLVKDTAQVDPVQVRLLHNAVENLVIADVRFEQNEETVTAVEKINKTKYKDAELKAQYSKPYRKVTVDRNIAGQSKDIRVFGLGSDVQPEDIAAAIQEYCTKEDGSEIVSAETCLIKNKQGFSIGLGRLTFNTHEEAEIVQKNLNGKIINGKVVEVDYWLPKQGGRGRYRPTKTA